jgi:predicted PurR-regulated permease PerM
MSRETLFAAFFFVALGFFLYQVYQVFSGFLAPAAWAAVLALVFYPVERGLRRWIQRPSLSALVTTMLVYLLVVAPSLTLSGVVIAQARTFYEAVQERAGSGDLDDWLVRVEQSRPARLVLRTLPAGVRENLDARALALRATRASTEVLVAALGGLALNFFRFVVDFLIMILLLFFFFRDGESLYRRFRGLLPMEVEHQDAIFGRLYDTISAVVRGMTVTAVTQAILAFLAFWTLGIPFAVLLGFATAFASFVPLGGAALVWVPCVVYLAAIEAWLRALLLLVWGAGVISVVDNVLKPWIIGDRTKIPMLFLFLGILGGIQAYGVIGVFLGPALLAVMIAFLRIYREEWVLRGALNRGAPS